MPPHLSLLCFLAAAGPSPVRANRPTDISCGPGLAPPQLVGPKRSPPRRPDAKAAGKRTGNRDRDLRRPVSLLQLSLPYCTLLSSLTTSHTHFLNYSLTLLYYRYFDLLITVSLHSHFISLLSYISLTSLLLTLHRPRPPRQTTSQPAAAGSQHRQAAEVSRCPQRSPSSSSQLPRASPAGTARCPSSATPSSIRAEPSGEVEAAEL